MTKTTAHRKYMGRMIGGAGLYAGAVIGASFAIRNAGELTPFTTLLAFLPGLGLVLMIYAMWRFLREVDEVGRFFLSQSLIIALFGTLALSGVWGLAELFLEDLPRVPVFFVFPLAMGLFGLASCFGPARGMGRA